MRRLGAHIVLVLGFCFLTQPVNCATIAVCDEASLRTALAGGGDISFACDGTITLSNTIVVNVSATLDAAGHDVTISGGGAVRLFQVSPGVTFGLRNLQISRGFTRGTNGVLQGPGGPADGAGVYNVSAVVFAADCRFSDNQSFGGTGGIGINTQPGQGGPARGAALFSDGGQLFLTNCVFTNNVASGGVGGTDVVNPSRMGGAGGFGGGGAVGIAGGEAWFLNCALVGNRATALTNGAPAGQRGGTGQGGAIYAHQATVHANQTLFEANVSEGAEGAFSNASTSGVQPGMGGSGHGGAIYSGDTTLLATNCDFRSNRALGGNGGSGNTIGAGGDAAGGMLYASNGVVYMVLMTIAENHAISGLTRRLGVPVYGSGRVFGGALYNGGAVAHISRSTILNNSAAAPLANSAFGGAVYQAAGALMLDQCMFFTNRVSGGSGAPSGSFMNQSGGPAEGGALHIAQGQARLTSCALVGNGAFGGHQPGLGNAGPGYAGGIFNRGVLNATNSTVADNYANGGDTASASFGFNGGSGYGGGIFNASGTSFLSHVTIASNRAQPGSGGTNAVSRGGGIFSTNGSTLLHGSILAYNVRSNCFGSAFTDAGFNISSDSSYPFSGTSQHSTDPRLAPINDYGGNTLTMPLLAGSPAIDAATGPDCPPFDQRGRVRPFGASCDIGAFESSPPYTIQGRVTGHFVPPGLEVATSTQTTLTDPARTYRFTGLMSGDYTVVPSSVTHLMVPASRLISVGPDIVDVDFRGYLWNSVHLEGATENTLRLVYAGTNGNVVRIQGSSDLGTWSDRATNTVGPDGLFEISVQNNGHPGGQYFRAVKP